VSRSTETRAALFEELQTNGAWAAYRASLAVCQDTKAPAAARAQAASNILRAAGFFIINDESRRTRKEPSEMSFDELTAAINELRSSAGQDGGVFE